MHELLFHDNHNARILRSFLILLLPSEIKVKFLPFLEDFFCSKPWNFLSCDCCAVFVLHIWQLALVLCTSPEPQGQTLLIQRLDLNTLIPFPITLKQWSLNRRYSLCREKGNIYRGNITFSWYLLSLNWNMLKMLSLRGNRI